MEKKIKVEIVATDEKIDLVDFVEKIIEMRPRRHYCHSGHCAGYSL